MRVLRRIARTRITLFVTDVPGPRGTLCLGGARLVRAVPVAPLVQGVPLGIAALSYAGRLEVAVNADAAVGDLDGFVAGMRAEFTALGRAARLPADGTGRSRSRPHGQFLGSGPAAAGGHG